MHDDLVKRLRDAAKMSEALAVLLPHSEGNATAKLYNEAADAIKELQKDSVPIDDMEMILSEVAKPRWIPVTERLPEIGTYIVAGRMKYDYEKAYTYFVDVSYFGPRWNDADYSWQTFNDWFEGQQEFEITHWQPLPMPPKESEYARGSSTGRAPKM